MKNKYYCNRKKTNYELYLMKCCNGNIYQVRDISKAINFCNKKFNTECILQQISKKEWFIISKTEHKKLAVILSMRS